LIRDGNISIIFVGEMPGTWFGSMPKAIIDMTGNTYGTLTVIGTRPPHATKT